MIGRTIGKAGTSAISCESVMRIRPRVDAIGMSKRMKYPQEFVPSINVLTLETEMIPESVDHRRSRLRRNYSSRRRAAFASRHLKIVRVEAIAEAFQLYYAGMSFPIHFDVVHSNGEYTKTERFTLVDAGFSTHCFKPDEIVGSLAGICIQKRASSLPAHFVWPKHDQ